MTNGDGISGMMMMPLVVMTMTMMLMDTVTVMAIVTVTPLAIVMIILMSVHETWLSVNDEYEWLSKMASN